MIARRADSKLFIHVHLYKCENIRSVKKIRTEFYNLLDPNNPNNNNPIRNNWNDRIDEIIEFPQNWTIDRSDCNDDTSTMISNGICPWRRVNRIFDEQSPNGR